MKAGKQHRVELQLKPIIRINLNLHVNINVYLDLNLRLQRRCCRIIFPVGGLGGVCVRCV